MNSYTVDVIIPSYKPDKRFYAMLSLLQQQEYPVQKIIIVNTEKEYFDENKVKQKDNVEIIHIKQSQFDHGGTRAYAAAVSTADIMLFMTQDAIPKNKKLLTELIRPFEDMEVAAAYARQLPAKDCRLIERYTRSFNYGTVTQVKSRNDLGRLGIKTYFCSNVCAAYRKEVYTRLGGFVKKTIFNEDMIFASEIIKDGKKIVYASNAEVVHSHNYSNMQQFRRNFDLAVSQKQYAYAFQNVKSESEGFRLVKNTARYLIAQKKPWLIVDLVVKSGFKYMGYLMGKNYERLPRKMVLVCTMNKAYWGE